MFLLAHTDLVQNLTVSSDRTSLTFTWEPPVDADNLITGYEIMTPGSSIVMTMDTAYTVTGLTPNTTYTVFVRSVNDLGPGLSSTIIALTDPNGE